MTKNPIKPFAKANTVKEAFGISHYDVELFVVYEKLGLTLPANLDIDSVWKLMSENYLTNNRWIGDLILEKFDKEPNEYGLLNKEF